jgi:hypothetical protein
MDILDKLGFHRASSNKTDQKGAEGVECNARDCGCRLRDVVEGFDDLRLGRPNWPKLKLE